MKSNFKLVMCAAIAALAVKIRMVVIINREPV